MAKHNYSQYSNKRRETNDKDVAAPEVKKRSIPTTVTNEELPITEVVAPVPELVQETVNTVTLPETVPGMVTNCAKLNVRENATVDSGIVCVLDVLSEIEIDVNRSTKDWCYVYLATGAEGYCMRKYIDAHL